MAKADWSRALARPVEVRGGPTLKTLADVRAFVLKLPADRQNAATWAAVAAGLLTAAGAADPAGVTLVLELVLYLEGRWVRKR